MSISSKLSRETQTITWESDEPGTQPVTLSIETMSEELKLRGMYHGLYSRVQDAGALAFGHWDGKDKAKRYATDQEKLARMRRIAIHLNNPGTGWDWDLRPSSDPLAGKTAEELERLIAAAKEKLAGLGVG